MAHVRKTIRDNIISTLTGLTTTGSNVFGTRFYPLADPKLPCLCIYTNSETSEVATITVPRTKMRTLQVLVEAYVKANDDLDDALDAISVEIEEALGNNLTLSGSAKDLNVSAFDASYASEGDQPVGVGRFTIDVIYSTIENNVETPA